QKMWGPVAVASTLVKVMPTIKQMQAESSL
ncbi:MAG: hypothetical protein QOE38_3016, partial [Thermoleophilaceae bacterium]|nr:hypothetical protein [Thermoleophilaceae bacterium]